MVSGIWRDPCSEETFVDPKNWISITLFSWYGLTTMALKDGLVALEKGLSMIQTILLSSRPRLNKKRALSPLERLLPVQSYYCEYVRRFNTVVNVFDLFEHQNSQPYLNLESGLCQTYSWFTESLLWFSLYTNKLTVEVCCSKSASVQSSKLIGLIGFISCA